MNKVNALPKKQVGYFDGVIVYLFAILANLGAQLIAGLAGGGLNFATGKSIMTSNYFQLVCMLIFQLLFLAVPIIYCKCVKKVRPQLLAPISKPAPEVFLSIALPVLTMVGFLLPTMYFGLGLEKIGYNSAGLNLNTPGEMVLGIIVMCVAAPFVEELIFRGFLLSGLRTRYNDYIAALLCAVSFTFMHMNPEQTVYQFFLGYTCALAAIKCSNLIAPMIIHSLSNLIAVLMYIPAIGKPIDKVLETVIGNAATGALVTVGLALAAGAAIYFICFAMNKIRSKREEKTAQVTEPQAEEQAETRPDNKKVATILYCVTIGLCAVMWITTFVSCMITLPTL